jgi:hypothetical protein
MAQSRTLDGGMDVHLDSRAVAYVAQAYGADGVSRGPIGTRQRAIAKLIRRRQSQRTPLVFVSDAGPCGSWLARSLKQPGDVCGGARPPACPHRQATAGNLLVVTPCTWPGHALRRPPPVDVPAVDAEALCARRRARAEPLRALQAAPVRRIAC